MRKAKGPFNGLALLVTFVAMRKVTEENMKN